MRSTANTVEEYLDSLPAEYKEPLKKLRQTVQKHLPKGFSETMSYGMIGYVVPHSIYPVGYHGNPQQPLPFINIALQKNFIAFYHMGMYADVQLTEWFKKEYRKHSKAKLDMGKSCVRFKKPEEIPFKLIAELVAKVTPLQWIALYERNFKR